MVISTITWMCSYQVATRTHRDDRARGSWACGSLKSPTPHCIQPPPSSTPTIHSPTPLPPEPGPNPTPPQSTRPRPTPTLLPHPTPLAHFAPPYPTYPHPTRPQPQTKAECDELADAAELKVEANAIPSTAEQR